MPDFVFRAAMGRTAALVDDLGEVELLVLAAGCESDAAMFERDTIADLLVGSDEVTNANYARKTTPASVSDSGDGILIDATNVVWANVGAGDTWAKLVVFAGTVPLSAHDFAVTPNTGTISAQFSGVIEVT